MVHALQETWRVLAVNGTLLDLRPLSSKCPIELVTPHEEVQVGEVDAFGAATDDVAADRAIRQVVEDGSFVPGRDAHFNFEFYWDTVGEMKTFMEASRRMTHVVPSYADLEKAHRDVSAGAEGPVRLRCRRPMMLAIYRKAILRPLDPLQGTAIEL